MKETEIEEIEIDLLLEALFRLYGYDFRRYSKASITRRIRHLLGETGLGRVSEMIPELLNDKSFLEKLVYDFSITVTEMFRDPDFYRAVREQVIPYLKTYPFVKIWHAGCATGEEVYSMAIVLKEEGLYDRATIFATDFNNPALTKAKEGIYPLKDIKRYTLNYQDAGGTSSFSEYYHSQYGSVIMDQSLKKNITFANHNLVTDGTFSEMHLILCRNVLIYFTKTLQDRVLGLFNDSLIHGGFLCLGTKESIRFTDVAEAYDAIDGKTKIYQKKAV
ncbi:MAG: protein-glutamate O-methyltransferase CheR [Desulfobulbaceae bacterium]|nr:protein-glutamate O-methyltransferase CheR [Desulfobulbaceae bacterium]